MTRPAYSAAVAEIDTPVGFPGQTPASAPKPWCGFAHVAGIRRAGRGCPAKRHRAAAMLTIWIWGLVAAPSIGAQQHPIPQRQGKAQRGRSLRRAVAYFGLGAGLFFGGALLLKSADRYEKGQPACVYPLGCITPTDRVTSRGRQAGGAVLMGSGGVFALLGFREWYRTPFAGSYVIRRPPPGNIWRANARRAEAIFRR